MIYARQNRMFLVGIVFTLLAFLPVNTVYPVTIGSKFPIATTAREELGISAAFDGTNYLVGIQGDNIIAQLVSQSGTLVGSRISVGRTGGAPYVAFDGTNYLMVWEDDATHPDEVLNGQFISASGSLVGSYFTISPDFLNSGEIGGIAFGGGRYLVVYYKEVESTGKSKVYGRLVSPTGTMGSEITISAGYGKQGIGNVAFDGNNFLIVWTDDDNDYEVKGRFVSPTGSLGTKFTINASTYPSDNPLSVAFDGTNYLVVWDDEVGGHGSHVWDLFGQLVDTSGNLVGGVISVSAATGHQFAPFIAFDGTNYLVTWTDMRNDANYDGACDSGEGTCWDIYGQFISKSGALIGSEFTINTDSDNQLGGVAGFNGGKYFVIVDTGVSMTTDEWGDVYGVFVSADSECDGVATIVETDTGDFELLKQERKVVTVTVADAGGCPVAKKKVSAKVNSAGKKRIKISSSSKTTDENGAAAFTITAKKKTGNAKVIFKAGGVIKKITVKVVSE